MKTGNVQNGQQCRVTLPCPAVDSETFLEGEFLKGEVIQQSIAFFIFSRSESRSSRS